MYPYPLLRLTAARLVLGPVTADELVAAADAALCDGVYSPALGELAYTRTPTRRECDPLFWAAARELGLAVPDPAAAVRSVVDHVAAGVVEGRVDPLDGAGELYDLYVTAEFGRKYSDGVTDPLRPFVDLHYGIEEARGYAAYAVEQGLEAASDLTDLGTEGVRLARGWCRDRWGVAVAGAQSNPTVLAIAAGIDQDRAFDRLPVLADALEDAGCDSQELLAHCRGGGLHVRGCWAVDLVLRKG